MGNISLGEYIYFTTKGQRDVPKDIAEIICSKADVNSMQKSKLTPLECAIMHRRPDILKELIRHKADINIKTSISDTLLNEAVVFRSRGCMELLLRQKADPNP